MQILDPDISRSVAMNAALDRYLSTHVFYGEDINPHLQVLAAADTIAAEVTLGGHTCTRDDVVCLWLTRSVFDNVCHRVDVVSGVQQPAQASFRTPWTLDEALRLCRELRPFLVSAGFDVGLTGGTLTRGRSEKDVDIIVYPLQSNGEATGRNNAREALTRFGMRLFCGREELAAGWKDRGSNDQKWVEVWEHQGRRVDVFFLY